MNLDMPLTRFLIDLPKNTGADPAKLAAKYQITPAHAAGYLKMEGK